MLDWFIETGFGYLLGVAAVTLVGLLLVYRGAWGDRSKGRTRCPKCWYDMRGTVPRLECPECGHNAQHERRLHKHHRRWGRIVIGVVLVLLSVYPLFIVGGWWREQAAFARHRFDVFARIWLYPPVIIGPSWLVERLPDEVGLFFERKHTVYIHSPAQFSACQSLRYLREVLIGNVAVTESGLTHLKSLPQLRHIGLMDDRIDRHGTAEQLHQAMPDVEVYLGDPYFDGRRLYPAPGHRRPTP